MLPTLVTARALAAQVLSIHTAEVAGYSIPKFSSHITSFDDMDVDAPRREHVLSVTDSPCPLRLAQSGIV